MFYRCKRQSGERFKQKRILKYFSVCCINREIVFQSIVKRFKNEQANKPCPMQRERESENEISILICIKM